MPSGFLPRIISGRKQLYQAKVQRAPCNSRGVKSQLPRIIRIRRLGRGKRSIIISELRSTAINCDIVIGVNSTGRISNQSEVNDTGVISLHPEIICVSRIKDRNPIISVVREANVSRGARRHGHFKRRGDGGAERIRGVLRDAHVSYRIVCSKTWIISLETIVAQ